ncbi:ROK family protein [Pontibacter sp. HSC-36F09]|uniref:ROK family protein n=1 Tax=Pontibacter sp. HSC-36F09 TaxID=2910966 RepID=UPI00209D3CFF|nr:ROK family protein [Pontibacter sp. HSC-36F09]MCP2043576.1 glucokinase [Pontibacter sp. HSC-36F09]
MTKDRKIALGVDIGGSHITAAAVCLDQFEIIPGTSINRKIDNKASKEAVLEAWAGTIREVLETQIPTLGQGSIGITGIGIAMPGPFDYPNGIAMFEGNNKYECLYKVDVRKPLSELVNIPVEKIHYFNDASSFVVGAALQTQVLHKRTVGLTLGTGFGAAFLVNSLPAIEGEQIPENGCLWDKGFKAGIADDYFSTRWFVGKHEAATGETCSGVREMVASGHTSTQLVFEEFVENLTVFLRPYLEKFEAEALLIGGNISRSHHLFVEALRASLGIPSGLQIEIVEDTENCNMLGASHLMQLDYWQQQSALKAFF